MVDQKESVVTAERFAAGQSYANFRKDHVVTEDYAEKHDFNYEHTNVRDEDRRVLQELVARPNGPKKVLVLTEEWCPDCYRGAPVLARIGEAAGMDMRFLLRDQNLDIMNEFLKDGEFQSIPTAVFYTDDMRYIYHFVERPKKANDEMGQYSALRAGRSREESKPLLDEFQHGNVWAGWRDATVTEIVEKLRERVG